MPAIGYSVPAIVVVSTTSVAPLPVKSAAYTPKVLSFDVV